MPPSPSAVEPLSLESAWLQAMQDAIVAPHGELGPASVTVSNPEEAATAQSALIARLDTELLKQGKPRVNTVANTIFPSQFLRPEIAVVEIAEKYRGMYDRTIRRHRANQYGTYFLRLVDHPYYGNQLDWLVETLGMDLPRPLSVSIFDVRDASAARRRGFPCLHHVSIRSANGVLDVAGYYTFQHLFSRLLGNLVGLSRLGVFLSQRTDTPLVRVSSLAHTLTLDCTKQAAQALVSNVQTLV